MYRSIRDKMGKYSEALDKAGYQNGIDKNVVKKVQELKDTAQTVPPQPSSPDVKKTTEPAKLVHSSSWDKRLFKAVNNDLSIPEVFKTLRTRILFPPDGTKPPKTILITSAVPKEGKSFVTANLGVSLAQGMDQHSMLVDCDLRRPSLSTLFGMSINVGLVDYLRDEVALHKLINKTVVQKLSVLSSGKPPVNPAELLSSSRMRALIDELSLRYEDRIILIDSPPILVASESSVLAGQVDGVILVVRQGVSRKSEIQKVIDTIGAERILGIVFNDYTESVLEKPYRKGYGYYHHNDKP